MTPKMGRPNAVRVFIPPRHGPNPGKRADAIKNVECLALRLAQAIELVSRWRGHGDADVGGVGRVREGDLRPGAGGREASVEDEALA